MPPPLRMPVQKELEGPDVPAGRRDDQLDRRVKVLVNETVHHLDELPGRLPVELAGERDDRVVARMCVCDRHHAPSDSTGGHPTVRRRTVSTRMVLGCIRGFLPCAVKGSGAVTAAPGPAYL